MAQVSGHRNLVALVGVVTSGAPLLLLLSFCEKGSLLSYLKSIAVDSNAEPLTELARLTMAHGITEGMQHLVEHHFVHRDLAARNVLVDALGVCKVADFGLSRLTAVGSGSGTDGNEQSEYYRSQSGTFPIRWTSPEAFQEMKFTTASDVWSFAIVVIEIYTDGAKPYPGMKNAEVINSVSGGYRTPKPPLCSAKLYKILLDCWSEDPSDRPRFDALAELLAALMSDAGPGDAADPGPAPEAPRRSSLQNRAAAPADIDELESYAQPVQLSQPEAGSRMSEPMITNQAYAGTAEDVAGDDDEHALDTLPTARGRSSSHSVSYESTPDTAGDYATPAPATDEPETVLVRSDAGTGAQLESEPSYEFATAEQATTPDRNEYDEVEAVLRQGEGVPRRFPAVNDSRC